MKPILRKIDPGYNNSFSVREDIYPFLYNHWHYHPEAELTYIRRGTGTRVVGDSLEEFREGDLILLGSNLPHVWRSDEQYFKGIPDLHIEAIAIHFKEDFWGHTFLDLPEVRIIKTLFEKAKKGIKIRGNTRDKLIPMMEDMLKLNGIGKIQQLISLLSAIAGCENDTELLCSAGFNIAPDYNNYDRINMIYTYTINNFQKPITIKEVASEVNISPHSFCRYFKTRTMKTYWEFLLEVRIGYACKLLIENKKSIAEICYESGFNNLSNFNRHFKNHVGVTPMQYMKSYQTVKNVPSKTRAVAAELK